MIHTLLPVKIVLYTEYTVRSSPDVKYTNGELIDCWVELVGVACSVSSSEVSASEPDMLDRSPDGNEYLT